MNENIIIPAIVFFTVGIIAVSGIFTSFLLKREKIKAEALIRSEEIQAKNRLDIEMLLMKSGKNNSESNVNLVNSNESNLGIDVRTVRERQR